METVLKVTGVSKQYQKRLVLDKVNMTINEGDIYGFVGENGSGKTTIIRAITGLIFPHEGDIEIYGVNSKSNEVLKQRRKMGAIVESPSYFYKLTVIQLSLPFFFFVLKPH